MRKRQTPTGGFPLVERYLTTFPLGETLRVGFLGGRDLAVPISSGGRRGYGRF